MPWLFATLFSLICFFSYANAQSDVKPPAKAEAAQTVEEPAPPAIPVAQAIVLALTAIIVPLVIAGVKKLKPSIPSWSLPILAPALGALITYLEGITVGSGTSASGILLAVIAGSAGVGFREVKDQLFPARPTL